MQTVYAMFCGIWSGSTMFANVLCHEMLGINGLTIYKKILIINNYWFIALDKWSIQINIAWKYMLWVLIRSASLRHF